VEISQTIPDNTTTLNIYKTLCTITVSGGVITANGIVPQYYGGDIRDYFVIPDANSAYDASSAKRFYSMELSPRGGRHEGTLQDYDWDNKTSTAMTDADFLMFKKVVNAGTADEYLIKKYCDYDDFKAKDSFDSDHANEADHADTADTATNVTNTPVHAHTNHSVFNIDDHNPGTGIPYLLLNANGGANRNLCHNSMVIGDNNNVGSIGPSPRWLYDVAGNGALNWRVRELYDSTQTAVMNWDTLNGTPKNWHLTWNATNKWTPAAFKVSCTDDFNIGMPAVGAIEFLKTAKILAFTPSIADGNVWIGTNTAPWVTIYAYASDMIKFHAGAAVERRLWMDAAAVSFYGSSLSTVNLRLGDDTSVFANIYFNGVAGRDITGWTTKGGVTGTGVEEITWGDIRPTDRILVRR